MQIRKLTMDEVEFEVIAEMDDIPVRGNAIASGDEEVDRECEDEIMRRLDNGDVWAWASVEVKATWKGFEGSDYLGGCSYEDEADFCQPGGYYDDMKGRALEELQANIEHELRETSELILNVEDALAVED